LHRRGFQAIRWLTATTVALFAVIGGIVGIWGPPWPTDPEIHPHDTTDGSSLVLPFIVKNRSAFFDMLNVKFRCGIDLVYAEDSHGQRVGVRDTAFMSGVYSVPWGGSPINYPCDASDLLQVKEDGALTLRGSSTVMQSNKPQHYYPPWKILKMCVWVGGEYKVMGRIPWSFTSMIFQWPATPKLHQWIEGPIAREPPKEEQLPGFFPNALPCSEAVKFPYGLTMLIRLTPKSARFSDGFVGTLAHWMLAGLSAAFWMLP
jgi:hypothetical protein